MDRSIKMEKRRTNKKSGILDSLYGRSYLLRLRPDRVLMSLIGVWLVTIGAHAQDATWSTNPGSGDWNTPANWVPTLPVPPTVPTGTASFGTSTTTAIALSNDAAIGELQFNAG